MSNFEKVYKKLNEASLTQKTAFALNKRLDANKKDLDKIKKEYMKTVESLSSDRELYMSHKNVIQQTFDQLDKTLADLQDDVKSRM